MVEANVGVIRTPLNLPQERTLQAIVFVFTSLRLPQAYNDGVASGR
jgi:hypothetical protein